MILGIIPARAGSRGIPGKNYSPLYGKPLIAHTIEAAQASIIDRLLVTSDCNRVTAIAGFYEVEVIERPANLSTDNSVTEDAILHVLETINDQPSITVLLQCTTPFTRAEDIDNTIKLLKDTEVDSAFSVTEFHGFVYQDGKPITHMLGERPRRQDIDMVIENGAVYAFRTWGFMGNPSRIFGNYDYYVMPKERSFEIDDPVDMVINEAIGGTL